MAWDLTGNSSTNPFSNFLGTTDNQPLVIKANSSERLRITADANVLRVGDRMMFHDGGWKGLAINGRWDDSAGFLRIADGPSGLAIFDTGAGRFLFSTGAQGPRDQPCQLQERIIVGSGADVLRVGDRIMFHDGGWKGLAINGHNWDDKEGFHRIADGASAVTLLDTQVGGLHFLLGPTGPKDQPCQVMERLTIQNDGKVGIATTTPAAELEVNGVIRAQDVFLVSDATAKSDIESVSNALESVKKLRGVTFTRQCSSTGNCQNSAGKSRGMGVIAQEVEEVYPELISDASTTRAVNYSGLVAVLIEACKELSEQVSALQQQVSSLSGPTEKSQAFVVANGRTD